MVYDNCVRALLGIERVFFGQVHTDPFTPEQLKQLLLVLKVRTGGVPEGRAVDPKMFSSKLPTLNKEGQTR